MSTWRKDHPHARDKSWTEHGGLLYRTAVWSWVKCGYCGAKCSAVVGAAGTPVCDECFEVEAAGQ